MRASGLPSNLLAIAGTGAAGDWSPRGLRARCAALANALKAQGESESTLAAWWPGGAQNPGRDRQRPWAADAGAWIQCFATYHRLVHARTRHRDALAEGNADALNAAIAAAATDQPEEVTCSDGAVRRVYPKGQVAIDEIIDLDLAMGDLLLRQQALRREGDPAWLGLTARRALATRVWCWIATHPGPEVPYTDDTPADAVPTWPDALAPQDLYALVAAYRRVNGEREAIMAKAFPRSPDGMPSRLDFVGFGVAWAGSKNRDPDEVLRRWSRPRLVAVATAEAVQHDEARKRAEANRPTRDAGAPGPTAVRGG